MPIKPENRERYPKDWPAISRRIRYERAGNKCERCKAPNGQLIARGGGPDAGTYMVETGEVYSDTTGEHLRTMKGSDYSAPRFVKVVLTVAHIDHTPENCADSNLLALCQMCHLRHDAKHHAQNAAATRRGRKAARELFT